jgi:inhibitor of KinA sporulation pathway (predicted exonuclease)
LPIHNLKKDFPLKKFPSSGTLVIIDLEYTSWRGAAKRKWNKRSERREIVQIGLVKVNAKNFEVLEKNCVYVRPENSFRLSRYFTLLTRIDRKVLFKKGVSFKNAMKKMKKIIPRNSLVIFNGSDGEVLRENSKFRGVPFAFDPKHFFNFRPLLSKSLNLPENNLVSGNLPSLLKINNKAVSHDALKDCLCIASSFKHLRSIKKI